MLIDRTHRKWAVISTVIFVVATLSYLSYANSSPKGPTGGSFMGLLYGVIGSAFMIFAGLLAGRKQVPHWRLGSAQFWLRGHIWLGTLSLPFILYHSGFGLGGRLEQVLWFFFIMVIGSGFFGLIMQHLLPKLLLVQIPRETFLAQLPYVKQRTRFMCDKLVSQDCGRLPLPSSDVMSPQITLLGKHAMEVKLAPAAKAREIKSKWTESLQAPFKLLFVELAKYAKAEKWITREDDFTQQMLEIYVIPGVNDDDASTEDNSMSISTKMIASVRASLTGAASTASEGQSTASRKLSALEQMKMKKAARDAELSQSAAEAALNEPAPADESALDLPAELDFEGPSEQMMLSSLERTTSGPGIKNAAADNSSVLDHTEDASLAEMMKFGLSDQMKQQANAKKASLAPATQSEGVAPLKQVEAAPQSEEKKLTPLEIMKAKAAAKKAEAEAAAQGGAATVDASATPASAEAPKAEEKKLTPLEIMKAKAAAKKAEAEAAAQGGAVTADASATPASAEAPKAEEKKLTPLEIMKAKAAAKKAEAEAAAQGGSATADASATPASAEAPKAEEKKLTPLEIMKAKAAAKKAEAEAAAQGGAATADANATAANAEAPKAEEKKLSPLEMMKAKAAAAKASTGDAPAAKPAPAAASATDKPKSPLEMMKAKAAASGAAPAAKPAAPNKAAPAAAAPVIVTRQVLNAPLLRTDELRQFYVSLVRPYLGGDGRSGRFSNPNDSKREFARMRDILPVELHDSLTALEVRCDEHRQFSQLERIHHWLHYWLILHIPFSIALLVMFAAHVIMALRVVPF